MKARNVQADFSLTIYLVEKNLGKSFLKSLNLKTFQQQDWDKEQKCHNVENIVKIEFLSPDTRVKE